MLKIHTVPEVKQTFGSHGSIRHMAKTTLCGRDIKSVQWSSNISDTNCEVCQRMLEDNFGISINQKPYEE